MQAPKAICRTRSGNEGAAGQVQRRRRAHSPQDGVSAVSSWRVLVPPARQSIPPCRFEGVVVAVDPDGIPLVGHAMQQRGSAKKDKEAGYLSYDEAPCLTEQPHPPGPGATLAIECANRALQLHSRAAHPHRATHVMPSAMQPLGRRGASSARVDTTPSPTLPANPHQRGPKEAVCRGVDGAVQNKLPPRLQGIARRSGADPASLALPAPITGPVSRRASRQDAHGPVPAVFACLPSSTR